VTELPPSQFTAQDAMDWAFEVFAIVLNSAGDASPRRDPSRAPVTRGFLWTLSRSVS
jgi:hypothetical protein